MIDHRGGYRGDIVEYNGELELLTDRRTVVAGGDLSDPLRVSTDEMPRMRREVARDRNAIANSTYPAVARCAQVGTTTSYSIHAISTTVTVNSPTTVENSK